MGFSFLGMLLQVMGQSSIFILGLTTGQFYVVSPGGGLVAMSCPTLVTPCTVACQTPLSMGILRARILEWVAISFSRGSS